MAKDHEETKPEANPETGAEVYPAWTLDGYPMEASGAIEECDCDQCGERREAYEARK